LLKNPEQTNKTENQNQTTPALSRGNKQLNALDLVEINACHNCLLRGYGAASVASLTAQ